MRFRITLASNIRHTIPMNYQYPLSAAIYKIIAKGDAEYASFLHETGYGKGFKLFTFSQINCPFNIQGDRMQLLSNELTFQVAFHLPQAMENFIKGLFQSERIEIADKRSKGSFAVQSVESLPSVLQQYPDNEIISVMLTPQSPVVAGIQNEQGNYDFLSPGDVRFVESIIYNWRSKIETCYDKQTAENAVLLAEIIPLQRPFKSRLITIKSGTPEETKIRGWMNFRLKVTAEKRFVQILLNCGACLYNSMGCGCVE